MLHVLMENGVSVSQSSMVTVSNYLYLALYDYILDEGDAFLHRKERCYLNSLKNKFNFRYLIYIHLSMVPEFNSENQTEAYLRINGKKRLIL